VSRKRKPQARHEWQPMRKAARKAPPPDAARLLAEAHGLNVEDAEEAIRVAGEGQFWMNDRYTAVVQSREDGSVSEISIRRNDRKPIRDWRDFQRIKNEIAGPEVEAVELYPAMSRLMDTANQFYLWVLPPGEQFPLGYTVRSVLDHTPGLGSQQRTPPPEWMDGPG
jgi:hypothetical protein